MYSVCGTEAPLFATVAVREAAVAVSVRVSSVYGV